MPRLTSDFFNTVDQSQTIAGDESSGCAMNQSGPLQRGAHWIPTSLPFACKTPTRSEPFCTLSEEDPGSMRDDSMTGWYQTRNYHRSIDTHLFVAGVTYQMRSPFLHTGLHAIGTKTGPLR
jgi:hypothetical protein